MRLSGLNPTVSQRQTAVVDDLLMVFKLTTKHLFANDLKKMIKKLIPHPLQTFYEAQTGNTNHSVILHKVISSSQHNGAFYNHIIVHGFITACCLLQVNVM